MHELKFLIALTEKIIITTTKNTMKKYDYWIQSGKYTAIKNMFTLFVGVLSFIFLARMLVKNGSTATYGIWGLFMVISSVTETARVSLIRNAFIRFIYQSKEEEHPTIQSAAFVLNLAISIVLSIVFLALAEPSAAWLKAPELTVMLQWYSITILLNTLFAHCEMLMNANTDFRGICWMYSIRQGFLLTVIAFCFVFKIELTLSFLSVLYLLSVLIGSISGLRLAMPYIKWHYKSLNNWIPKLWHFGKYVFGTNACAQLFRGTDNFITAKYFGTGITAYYSACLRIGNLADMPSQVLGDILLPKVAKYTVADKASIKKMYEKSVGATLTFSIPVLLTLLIFPSIILKLLAGDAFVNGGVPILRITAFFGFILPFLKQFGNIMDGTGHPDVNFKTMLFAFCINVINNLIGAHYLGVTGAALGTLTTYCIILFVMQWLLYKKFEVSLLNVFKYTIQFYPEFLQIIKGFVLRDHKKILKPY